ncbi:RidA family protein [Alcaligenaceae bacterium CGII-47]|nr:RidA family protein [Alcaligenaceae bacterium CGII-47]
MTKKQIIDVPGLSAGMEAADIPLSSVVRANGMLYLSGMPPLDPLSGAILKDLSIAAQTRVCLENIRHVLESADSSMEKIVSVRVYCSDPTQFATVNSVYRTFFPSHPPARTFIPVASWQMGFEVEIECIALA